MHWKYQEQWNVGPIQLESNDTEFGIHRPAVSDPEMVAMVRPPTAQSRSMIAFEE